MQCTLTGTLCNWLVGCQHFRLPNDMISSQFDQHQYVAGWELSVAAVIRIERVGYLIAFRLHSWSEPWFMMLSSAVWQAEPLTLVAW